MRLRVTVAQLPRRTLLVAGALAQGADAHEQDDQQEHEQDQLDGGRVGEVAVEHLLR